MFIVCHANSRSVQYESCRLFYQQEPPSTPFDLGVITTVEPGLPEKLSADRLKHLTIHDWAGLWKVRPH